MLQLKPTPFEQVQQLFVDFQKKSKCFELPTDDCQFLGIYLEDLLVGYFALRQFEDGTLEIQHGYLKPIARHRSMEYESMRLLEKTARNANIKQICLKASRSLGAYQRFMNNLGFKPTEMIFSKDL